MTKRGMLVSFEGGEGGGKTVQTKLLSDRLLKELKRDSIALREPGGTAISEQIREIVLTPHNVDMAYTAEVLLFQAARAQIYQEVVIPSLAAGKIVLMDRSRDSSVVYQGMVRGLGIETIERFNDFSTKETKPDITFLLDVPAEIGLKRRLDSGKIDRLDMEDITFHEKVRQSYLTLAHGDVSGRWQLIDANRDISLIAEDIWQMLMTKLNQ